jgi:hypothetical protein
MLVVEVVLLLLAVMVVRPAAADTVGWVHWVGDRWVGAGFAMSVVLLVWISRESEDRKRWFVCSVESVLAVCRDQQIA